MVVITLSQAEWQLIVGIIWRIAAAVLFWLLVSSVTHALTGTK